MAENKVVNTTQLEADLTTIANAIREKTGGSDSLVFPEGFAEGIANIAGPPIGISKLATGTFVLSSATETHIIEHGLGVTPNFYLVVAQDRFEYKDWNNYIYRIVYTAFEFPVYIAFEYSNASADAIVTRQMYGATPGATAITTPQFSGIKFRSGLTYRWICGVIGDQN